MALISLRVTSSLSLYEESKRFIATANNTCNISGKTRFDPQETLAGRDADVLIDSDSSGLIPMWAPVGRI